MDWFSLVGVISLLCFAPFIVFYFVMACDQYDCSVSQPLLELYQGKATVLSIWARAPSFTWTAAKIYAVWVSFQVRFAAIRRCMAQKPVLFLMPGVLSSRSSSMCVFLTSPIRWFQATWAGCRTALVPLLVCMLF